MSEWKKDEIPEYLNFCNTTVKHVESVIGVLFAYVIYSPYFDDVIRFSVFETNINTQVKYEGWNFNSGNYLFTTDTK